MTWHHRQDEINPLLDQALNIVMRRFYRYIDRQDLNQELMLWVIAHPTKVEQYLNEERPWSLVKALENAGITYAQKEKAAQAGYSTADIFYWSEGDIREMLGSVLREDDWINPPQMGENESSTKRPASEGGNWVATLADLSRAFSHLDLRSQAVIRLVLAEGRTQTAAAKAFDVSDTTIANIIDRGVRKMHRELGGEKPHLHNDCECTGTRRVISNAEAAAVTRSTYEE